MKLLSTLIAGSALAIATPALAGDGYMKKNKMTNATTASTTATGAYNASMIQNGMYDTSLDKTVVASSADFAAYDGNRDGRVDFAEYSKWAKKEGLTTTSAAQRFTKMTRGQSYLDEGTFVTAMSLGNDYYDNITMDGVRSGATYIGNTAVLGSSVGPNGNIILPRSDADATVSGNYAGTGYDISPTVNTMTDASVQPMYRPEDKVGGDLTQTVNPVMDVRPDTVNALDVDADYNDARPDFTDPVR